MIKLYDGGVYLVNGAEIVPESESEKVRVLTGKSADKAEAKKGTMAYGIIKAHNQSDDMDQLRLKFDSMTSHDITYVGIIQTARASGMTEFPLPYVLTNCHNSLCAVGGTINEDDHKFALSAAHKYGGIYVPTNMANIHSYNRETMSGCGRMILGSDSHTRYGALGTMAIGEGGGELAKQLLKRTYDFAYPGVIVIYLTGSPRPGVGPQDVALSIIGAVYKNGYVKNKAMEFVGPDGVCRPRHCQSAHRVPQRHRRHDHRDHLLVLHLGHRREDQGLLRHPRSSRSIQKAQSRRGRVLRRLRLCRPLHR